MTRHLNKTLAVAVCFLLLTAVVALQQRLERPAQAAPEARAAAKPEAPGAPFFVIAPYLQFPTRTSIAILWETDVAGDSIVEYAEANARLAAVADPKKPNALPLSERVALQDRVMLHQVALANLKPNTKYYYRVSTTAPEGGKLTSSVLETFMTAVNTDSAYSFTIIGDTQKNPDITAKVARQMWGRRPNFVIHVGDVVDNGPDRHEWVYELFRPSAELLSRVAIFPAIGNHEKDHAHYYKYFAMPEPKYFYRYSYGNADFFVLDTNKSVKPGSEQYVWLDQELGKSSVRWKFAYHHHPAYTSDADDYGDTLAGQVSTLGDLNVRNLVSLYEKHNVDMVFNGHIHLYERTWPLRGGKVDRSKGIIYVTSGGGGGRLEDVAPTPAWFKAETRVDYHYCYVTIQGDWLYFKAFDHEGRLFDLFQVQK